MNCNKPWSLLLRFIVLYIGNLAHIALRCVVVLLSSELNLSGAFAELAWKITGWARLNGFAPASLKYYLPPPTKSTYCE